MNDHTRIYASLALATTLSCGPTPPTPPEGPCAGLFPGDLVITEFMADPAGSDTGKQYIEIYNTTDHALDLNGVSLFQSMADGSRLNTSVLPAAVVAPHAYFVLGDAGNDATARPAYLNFGYGSDLGALRHENGKLGLRCSTTSLAEVTYASVTSGRARMLDGAKVPRASEVAETANWCDARASLDALAPSSENFGTPGAPNEPCVVPNQVDAGASVRNTGIGGNAATGTGGTAPVACDAGAAIRCFDPSLGARRDVNPVKPGDLWITELMPAPSVNNNGAGEWLELHATRTVDLNGLELVNEGTGSTLLSSDTCLTISTNDWWVFARSSDATQNGGLPAVAGTFDFTLADSGSSSFPERAVTLRLAGQVIDRAVWLKSTKGVSLQRSSTDSSQASEPEWCLAASDSRFGAGDRGTPGATNAACTMEQVDAGGSASDAGNFGRGGTLGTSAVTTRNGSGGGAGVSSSVRVGGAPAVHIGGATSARSGAGGAAEQTGGAPYFGGAESGSGGAPAIGGIGSALGGNSSISSLLDGSAGDGAVIDASHGHTCFDTNGQARGSASPQPGDLVITEVMSAPSSNNNGAAEWFEVLVNADVDLNGLEIANEATGSLLVSSDACLRVQRGERLIFARGSDFEQNGGLPFVTLTFAFTLADSASSTHPARAAVLRFNGAELSRAEWTKSTKGASWQKSEDLSTTLDGGLDDAGTGDSVWCLSPTGLGFGVGDRGTPGLPNAPCP